jgi:hypothetical protein
MYQIQDDTLVTDDYRVVEIAEYTFQFQPELLVIDYFVTGSEINNISTQEEEASISEAYSL